ncbi:hypothetical protein HNR34_001970 [Geobacillus subterraneus]
MHGGEAGLAGCACGGRWRSSAGECSIHSLREVKLAPVETLEDYLARTAREDEQPESPTADRDPDDDPPSPSLKPGKRAHAEESGNFRGTTFSNRPHRSVTDPDARLYKKGKGQEAYPRHLVYDVIDVRSRVILSRKASVAAGTAERETSLRQLASIRFRHPSITIRTLSADKAYGVTEYLGSALCPRHHAARVAAPQGDGRDSNLEAPGEGSRSGSPTPGERSRRSNSQPSEAHSATESLSIHSSPSHAL